LPGGKSLSFVSPKESNPRKGDPDIPVLRVPENRACQVGGKELAPPCCFNLFFVGGAQTPLPLIHPAGSIFGVDVRGRKLKSGR
jgi:hypothetical protein